MPSRTGAALALALLGVLTGACAGESVGDGDGAGPAAAAPVAPAAVAPSAAPTPAPTRVAAVAPEPAVDFAREPLTEDLVASVIEEIRRLNTACAPARGVSRAAVEERFGPGKPAVASMIPVEAPPDSPLREYEFCDDGVLNVRYDDDWNVKWAHFHDSHSVKNRVAGRPVPLATRAGEAFARLAQMRHIREEVRRRFGDEASGAPAAEADAPPQTGAGEP